MLSKPIVITLFGYGEFNQLDISNTQIAMLGYSVSLLCFVLIRVITSAIYVSNKSSAVFRLSLVCLGVNVVMGILVVSFLSSSRYGFVALAIVTSVVAVINMILQMVVLSGSRERFSQLFVSLKYFVKIALATIIMLLFLWSINTDVDHWIDMSLVTRFVRLGGMIIAAVVVYVVVLLICRANKDISIKDNNF